MMKTKRIVLVTGVPGTGKSGFIHSVGEAFGNLGIKYSELLDYPVLREWVLEQGVSRELVVLLGDDNFMIREDSYRTVSTEVAYRIGEIIMRKFDDGYEVVFVEAARGAGGDNYMDCLVRPMFEGLGSTDGVLLANIEMIIPDMDELNRRNEERVNMDTTGTVPPVGVYKRYLDSDGPICSSVDELKGLGDVGIDLRFNQAVENSAYVFDRELAGQILAEKVIDELVVVLELSRGTMIEKDL